MSADRRSPDPVILDDSQIGTGGLMLPSDGQKNRGGRRSLMDRRPTNLDGIGEDLGRDIQGSTVSSETGWVLGLARMRNVARTPMILHRQEKSRCSSTFTRVVSADRLHVIAIGNKTVADVVAPEDQTETAIVAAEDSQSLAINLHHLVCYQRNFVPDVPRPRPACPRR